MKEKSVVIDHDILGWGSEHTEELLKRYQKVLKVGTEPGLERRRHDFQITRYDWIGGRTDKAVFLIQIVE